MALIISRETAHFKTLTFIATVIIVFPFYHIIIIFEKIKKKNSPYSNLTSLSTNFFSYAQLTFDKTNDNINFPCN